MTTQTLSQNLVLARNGLTDALKGLHAASEHLLEKQIALATAKSRILLNHAEDPKALGANEAARSARIDELTQEEREAFASAEMVRRQLALEVEIARLTWDLARNLVRAAEVEAR